MSEIRKDTELTTRLTRSKMLKDVNVEQKKDKNKLTSLRASLLDDSEQVDSKELGIGGKRRTRTKLEQTVQSKGAQMNGSLGGETVGSSGGKLGGQIRTQITFESDSDSLATDGSGQANRNLVGAKEKGSGNKGKVGGGGGGDKADGGEVSKRSSKGELITQTKYVRYSQTCDELRSGGRDNKELGSSRQQPEREGQHLKGDFEDGTRRRTRMTTGESGQRTRTTKGEERQQETNRNWKENGTTSMKSTTRTRNDVVDSSTATNGDYDYSLSVNRMRNERVDKRIK